MAISCSTQKEFKKIITTSKNWDDSLERLLELGPVTMDALRRRARRLKVRPGIQHDHLIPEGYVIKGSSTMVRTPAGDPQWIKTDHKLEHQLEVIKAVAQGFADKLRGTSKFIPPPGITDNTLLTAYIEPETHYGMYSWDGETGESFDCDIAEQLFIGGFRRQVAAAPPSEEAIFVGIGDGLHADNKLNQTANAGNQLDVDTRWGKVIRKYATLNRWLIEELLTKHAIVHVKKVKGNHDEHSSTAISLMLSFMFENNPRVIVDLGEAMIKYHIFGKNLLGIVHGEKGKVDQLPLIMATDQREAWGTTDFRYFYTGHTHHLSKKEFPGCVVESFRSIAAKDSWHAGQGYRSGRDMQMIVLHKDFGEIERHTVGVAQINQ